jgi:hypothetical protein
MLTVIDRKKHSHNNPFHLEGEWKAEEEAAAVLPHPVPAETHIWAIHLDSVIARTQLDKTRLKRREARNELIALFRNTKIYFERLRAFQSIKERLVVISEEEDEEDFTYKSSEYALDLVSKIIMTGYLLSSGQIIKPLIAVDGQGGLKFDWRAPDKEVRLFIPARDNRTPYLYYREGKEDNIINNPDGKTLANWLTWLNE